jgi:hypothetical protein
MLDKQTTFPVQTESNKTLEVIKREEASARMNLLRKLGGYSRNDRRADLEYERNCTCLD